MSTPSQVLVIHERLGHWGRQLRPRLVETPLRITETRSGADLQSALATAGVACPLLLVDLARRTRVGLEDLDLALRIAPEALSLVLDPEESEGAARLAREIGATLVLSGTTTPPYVSGLLIRWLRLSQRRADALGWPGPASEPNLDVPWNWLGPLPDAKNSP